MYQLTWCIIKYSIICSSVGFRWYIICMDIWIIFTFIRKWLYNANTLRCHSCPTYLYIIFSLYLIGFKWLNVYFFTDLYDLVVFIYWHRRLQSKSVFDDDLHRITFQEGKINVVRKGILYFESLSRTQWS